MSDNIYWLLKPKDQFCLHSKKGEPDNPWCPWYDTAQGFIVEAATETEARELADTSSGDENRKGKFAPWMDDTFTTCVPLTPTGVSAMVMCAFAGA